MIEQTEEAKTPEQIIKEAYELLARGYLLLAGHSKQTIENVFSILKIHEVQA